MTRVRPWLVVSGVLVAFVALLAVFVAIRDRSDLIAALSAAGTVAAALLAAVAAYGSMRAATESNNAGRQARAALAQLAKPTVLVDVANHNGTAHGRIACDAGRGAADVQVEWVLIGRPPVRRQTARLERSTAERPGGPGVEFYVDLGSLSNDEAEAARESDLVRLDYWDDQRVGHWRETFQPGPVTPNVFVRVDSRLLDN